MTTLTESIAKTPPITRRRSWDGPALLLLSLVFFAGSGVAGKFILDAGIGPITLAQVRFTGGFVVLLVFLALARPSRLRIARHQLGVVVAFGVVACGAAPIFYYIAISRIPLGIAALIQYSAPVLVVLVARYRGLAISKWVWAGLALVLAGLAMVLDLHDMRLDAIGLAAAVGGMVAIAGHYLLGTSIGKSAEPITMLCYGLGCGAVALAAIQPWWLIDWSPLQHDTALGPPVWLMLGAVAIFGAVVPFGLAVLAMRRTGSTGASIIGCGEPIFTVALAWLFLSQALSPVQLVGGTVVVVGVLVAEVARTPEPPS